MGGFALAYPGPKGPGLIAALPAFLGGVWGAVGWLLGWGGFLVCMAIVGGFLPAQKGLSFA